MSADPTQLAPELEDVLANLAARPAALRPKNAVRSLAEAEATTRSATKKPGAKKAAAETGETSKKRAERSQLPAWGKWPHWPIRRERDVAARQGELDSLAAAQRLLRRFAEVHPGEPLATEVDRYFAIHPDESNLELVVEFELPGRLLPKERPRFSERKRADGSRFVASYTPTKTANEEQRIKGIVSTALAGRPRLEDREFKVVVVVREPPSTRNTRRIDVDNGLKLVLDALNLRTWRDDIQVGKVVAEIWRDVDYEPSASVRVYAYPGKPR